MGFWKRIYIFWSKLTLTRKNICWTFNQAISWASAWVGYVPVCVYCLAKMYREQAIALWLCYRRRKRQRRTRRIHWVHPINQRREEAGLFYTLLDDLRRDEKKFFLLFPHVMQLIWRTSWQTTWLSSTPIHKLEKRHRTSSNAGHYIEIFNIEYLIHVVHECRVFFDKFKTDTLSFTKFHLLFRCLVN